MLWWNAAVANDAVGAAVDKEDPLLATIDPGRPLPHTLTGDEGVLLEEGWCCKLFLSLCGELCRLTVPSFLPWFMINQRLKRGE